MKKKLLSLILFFISTLCFSQGENNQWRFGFGAGLNFNSGSPVAVSSQVGTTEGSSNIADAAGNLLFYTDGITVWNKNNVAMPNGTGLFGGGSSTQSALIVPQPQTPDIYYIFTTAEAQGGNGFCYSIVDISLQGGLGDVTTKNVQLFTPSAEKVCGTKHNNGIDIWVLGHEIGTDNFYAYLLSSAGVSAPVISSVGTVHTVTSGVEIGYMKFSCDGRQLASAMRYLYSFELDSFNTATGVVSAPISFPSTGNIQSYGIEFSPNGNLLYTSDGSQVSQYDITLHDSASMMASKTYISNDVWALQLGPDRKIYVAEYSQSSLSVINDPDVPGTGCNYSGGSIPLVGSSSLGLPNMINNLCNGAPVAIFSAQNHICPGTCTDFQNLSVNASSFLWIFSGANPGVSTDVNPVQICYNSPGQYNVMLIASNPNGDDTLLLPNFITVYPYPSPQGIIQSGDTLYANQGAISYQWYYEGALIPGATDYFYVAPQSGNFSVVASDQNGCEVEAVVFDVIASSLSLVINHQSLVVYPVPVEEKLWIRIPDFINGDNGIAATIKVFDVVGKYVSPLTVYSSDQKKWVADVSFLAEGIYSLQLETDKNIFHLQFIKSAGHK